ncbi:nucleotide-binding alpha-beta plait domain-containing protein [Tanacetum coccineum]
MAIGTGHRSNNYSESKRNDHLDNNRRQEQRNKGIPNKSHPNFRKEHKSFSSIFVSNIPWNASVQDLWDICNKWGVVIDVYIAAKRSKSGHRFGFVRFINVNDINQLVSNLRTAWMGGFHLFADVAKYGRTYNRPVERSGDGKPSVVDMSGKYGTCNAGAESVGVSDCNKVYKEAGNEAVMSISVDDCIDLDGMERSILAKVKDLSVISELLKHMSSEGFDDVLVLDSGWWTLIWLEFDSMDPAGKRQDFKQRSIKRIFLEFKDFSHQILFPEMKDVYWIDLVGLPLRTMGSRGGFVISVLYNDGCIKGLHGKELEDDAVESGSSWIDYIGPLTSDEIDSDKRWSYRDPNGNIHGLFSLAQLRSWKDYFPSDLQIWSYYGNVKKAILLHNALSRQTNDAG